jgi:ABC-2 type transport system permease protein
MMFWHVLRLESQKTFQRRLFWLGLLILAAVIMFFYSMFFAFRGSIPASVTQSLSWPLGLLYGLNYAIGFTSWASYGTVLLIVLVGVLTAQEYSWRTMQLWLSHGVPRSLLLGTKFLLALAFAPLIVLLCLASIGGLSAFFSLQLHGTINVQGVDFAQLLLSFVRTAYAMLPYAALTFLLAVASRSTMVAVAGGLAFMMVVESSLAGLLPMLGDTFARLVQYLPSGLAAALNSQNYALAKMAVPYSPLQPSPLVAAIGIAIYTLVFSGLALWIFRRQNLVN